MLDASFHPGGGIDLAQQGNRRLPGWRAQAWGGCSYTPADQILVLTASPELSMEEYHHGAHHAHEPHHR
jgi:hypothetical protein